MNRSATVLIADDDPIVLKMLDESIRSEGYNTIAVMDGEAALEAAIANTPDLILLDVMMPGLDGYEVCRRLRSHPILAEVPIIIITFLDDRDSRIRGIEAGADDFISKPLDLLELKARVQTITRLNRYRKLLRERANLEKVIENSPNGILVVDSDSKILLVNRAMVEMLGMEKSDDLIGYTLYRFIAAEHYDEFNSSLKRVLEGEEQACHMEIGFISTTGRDFPADMDLKIYLWDERPSAQIIVRDITERKQAQEKIFKQASLIDIANDAIMVSDLHRCITFWSKGAERIYGWTAAEAVGKKVDELIYEGGSKEFSDAVETVLKKSDWSGELHHVAKDRRKITAFSRLTLMRSDKDQPQSILVVHMDITEKKQLEEQLLRAQRMETIGALAGGIAHDLNNLFTPILISLQLLKKKYVDADERNQQIFEVVENTAQRGADLVKQVLSFGKGLEGKSSFVQARHIILELEKVAKETFPKSIAVSTNIPKDLWMVTADATQLHQIIMNLAVNARDAMPEGGNLHINAKNFFIDENYAKMTTAASAGPYIIISVADSGSGIPDEIKDKIFEPFFTTKEQHKGTGLGLYTVRSIVKNHGGFVNVYSEPGKGTELKIYLPAIDTPETKPAEAPLQKTSEGKGELILVVDDEASIREITKATLETFNYKAVTASDGIEAMVFYSQHIDDVKVLLTDMMMPVMDGIKTAIAMRRLNPQLKIIAVSGLMTPDKVSNAKNVGINALLTKPYTAEELLNTMQTLLNS